MAPHAPEPIDRCVCHGVTLARLVQLARDDHLDLPQLKQRTRCCTSCGLCEPYVKLSLATGKARWPVLSPAQAQELLNRLTPS